MLRHSQWVWKIACGVLATVLLFEVITMVVRLGSRDQLSIPDVPHLPANVESPGGSKATNLMTGPIQSKTGTNSNPGPMSGSTATNLATNRLSKSVETNAVQLQGSNATGTNPPVGQAARKSETNSASVLNLEKGADNALPQKAMAKGGTNGIGRTGPLPMTPVKLAEIPPPVQARIDRIYQSEILGSVTRQLPMGLLGIAGNVAFLRAPNGQTGMVKEGDELGGMKLLQIGVNRVMVSHDGKTNELTIFSGFGSETLLQKPKETPNETVTKSR